MSNAIFPTLPGLTWDIPTSPQFNTRIHRAVSGSEVRAALMTYPLWKFALKYDLIRDTSAFDELRTLAGFFNARQGSFDSFLYSVPADHAVVAAQTGVGTGVQLDFQLVRSYGGYTEPVQNVNGSPSIYVDGVLKVVNIDYTLSATGVVSFFVAPAYGAVITWTGSFYYRCRFVADSVDFNAFMLNRYNINKLELIGSPMNKL